MGQGHSYEAIVRAVECHQSLEVESACSVETLLVEGMACRLVDSGVVDRQD